MRPMPELEVCEMAVADLVPYANNAKMHPREQIDQIAESISEFGNCDPIAVWHNEDGEAEIVEGHGRVLALKKLGIETAPVICLDHLTDEQRRAYTHVHNQTTLNSGFDYQTLVEDMDNLDMDWEALGFAEFMPKFDDDEEEPQDEEDERVKLADDRFAVVVIGDARGKDVFYYNLPGKTVEFMERAGARYYNEAILVTPAGSLPIRAGRQFAASRKLGKTHQNVLTFCKGDPREAAGRLGEVVIPDLEEQE